VRDGPLPTIDCPKCGKPCAQRARLCPFCGAAIAPERRRRGADRSDRRDQILKIVGILVLLAAGLGWWMLTESNPPG
jgi:hypothetical protein